MALDLFTLVYILGNLFSAYIIFKFIRIFYSECRLSHVIERTAYLGYFAIITCTHMLLSIPYIVFFYKHNIGFRVNFAIHWEH